MFSKTLLTAVACGLLAATNAHMIITSPVPYGKDTLNNSPLENDGSDFPCKQRSGVYDVSTMNQMPVGVPQKLAFQGGATHGGGSCQISVTLDKQPTKDSQWKVIHTILGGCPNSASGNADGAPTYDSNPTFEFSIPKGMPNGEYTLAWTWLNKIGNREIYMNCAPISVSGGADNNDVYNTLPDMFVINLPREECSTTEMEDFVFPDPGLYVETYQKTALGSSTSGSNCAAVTAKGAGTGSAGSVAQPTGYSGGSSAAAPPYPSSSSVAPTGAPSAGFAVPYASQTDAPASPFLLGTGTAPPSVATAYNMVTLTSMLTVTASSPSSSAQYSLPVPGPSAGAYAGVDDGSQNGTTTSSASCTGGGVACSSDGAVVCIGSDQWGICNAGCAVPMALAAGTSCSGGTIAKRDGGEHLRRHLLHARKF